MKNIIPILILIVAIFLAGRFTAPRSDPDSQRILDSLNRDIATRGFLLRQARDSVKQMNTLADTWFKEAERWRKAKTVVKTQYIHDTVQINSLTPNQLDSALRAIYPPK